MRRRWLLALFPLALAAVAFGQAPNTSDDLTYRDRSADGKLVDIKTETKESIAGIEIIVAGKVKMVLSPADVVRYDYGSVAGTDGAALAVARSMERGGDVVKANAAYADLLKKLPASAPDRTRRHLSYREALTAARIADTMSGEEFTAKAADAAARLTAVFRMSLKHWEAWPSARLAARLHAELGQFDKAAALYGELAGIAELPRELKYEARLEEAAALIRAGQALTAEAVLDQLGKESDTPAGPLKERLAILRIVATAPKPADPKSADAIAKLEAAIAQAKDPSARAVGYNFLGDLHAARGQHRDAMWSYLWVDTVFNQDKDERILAVHRLVTLFENTGDRDRADEFRTRLTSVR